MNFDVVVVGAGISGIVIAERFATQSNKKVLLIEKRNHIGGNCYDFYDENQVLIHKYGPHIFHTNSKKVWEYLSIFTDWYFYRHKVLALVDGKKIPLPFNLNSLYKVFSEKLSQKIEDKLIQNYGFGKRIPILKLRETEDVDLTFLANFVYEKIFLNYTIKQWGLKPEELEPEVTGRVPILISKNDDYFPDIYQAMPLYGYTKMFEKMLENKNIKILLNTDARSVLDFSLENNKIFLFGKEFKGIVIYTGQIEEIIGNVDYLPYRSLRFEKRNENKEWFQEVAVVNYPNDYDYTRITEFKHITGQSIKCTSYFLEFPQNYDPNDSQKSIPYYPIPQKKNKELYLKYKNMIANFKNLYLLGRLGNYQYINIDQAVENALTLYETLK